MAGRGPNAGLVRPNVRVIPDNVEQQCKDWGIGVRYLSGRSENDEQHDRQHAESEVRRSRLLPLPFSRPARLFIWKRSEALPFSSFFPDQFSGPLLARED